MILNASNAQLAAIENILTSGTMQDGGLLNNRQAVDESKRPMLYTRRKIAAIIQVDYPQLRKWAQDSNSELFTLPENGHRPYHRQQVLSELNRMHNRCRWLAPLTEIPEVLYTCRDVEQHFGICRRTLRTWTKAGAPRFVFSERTMRYLISELEQWYTIRYSRPRIK